MFFPKYRKTIILLSHFLCFLSAKPAKASLSSLQVKISVEQVLDNTNLHDIFSTEKAKKESVNFDLLLWGEHSFRVQHNAQIVAKHGMICGKKLICTVTPPDKTTFSTVLNQWYKGGDTIPRTFLLDLQSVIYQYLLGLDLNNLLDKKSYEMIKHINSQKISCYLKEPNSNVPLSLTKISGILKKKLGKGNSTGFSINEINFKRDGKLMSEFQGRAQEDPTSLNHPLRIDVELSEGCTLHGFFNYKIMYAVTLCVRALACFI